MNFWPVHSGRLFTLVPKIRMNNKKKFCGWNTLAYWWKTKTFYSIASRILSPKSKDFLSLSLFLWKIFQDELELSWIINNSLSSVLFHTIMFYWKWTLLKSCSILMFLQKQNLSSTWTTNKLFVLCFVQFHFNASEHNSLAKFWFIPKINLS